MSARLSMASLLLLTGSLFSPGQSVPRGPLPIEQPAQTQPGSPGSTTLDDQVDLGVTVYNSDIAMVRDVRDVQLQRGTFDLRFMDIAATVNPSTVHFRSLTDPSKVSVLEQNYEYDLLDPEKLLHKYVGRDVTLIRTRQAQGTSEDEAVKARLLSYNGQPVWQIGSEIVTGMPASQFRFPELPQSLYTRPTLIWTLENTGVARQRLEASYLAGRLSWNADYVLTVGRSDKAADLDGWVTLTNGSGTSFRNAKLQLVAGDLNRVRDVLAKAVMEEARRPMAAPAPMAQESFSDYHLYTLARKTTINNSETKQVSMLGATAVPIQKRYVVDGQPWYYRSASHPGAPLSDKVQVFYQFKNEAASGLGMPMPAGVLRVFQADSSGGVQFVGEDRVNHTPKDETLNVRIGSAFDVVCERKQTGFEKIAGSTYEFEYEITLRNHKTAPISVEVNEPVGGTWQMLASSYRWTKTAAAAAQFTVPVAVDGTSVLKYRVRVTF
jgi:hypothetical protein